MTSLTSLTSRTTLIPMTSLTSGTIETISEITEMIRVIGEQTATADFTLTPEAPPAVKTVLLEGFSNVDCSGCPELNATLHDFLGQEGYGPDRVLLIKYAVNCLTKYVRRQFKRG